MVTTLYLGPYCERSKNFPAQNYILTNLCAQYCSSVPPGNVAPMFYLLLCTLFCDKNRNLTHNHSFLELSWGLRIFIYIYIYIFSSVQSYINSTSIDNVSSVKLFSEISPQSVASPLMCQPHLLLQINAI